MSDISHKTNDVFFAFFIILATTLNFSFFWGDLNNPDHHPVFELYVAIVVNLIALALKLGTKTQIDSIQLATSVVSCLQLFITAFLWFYFSETEDFQKHLPSIVSFSGGALIANLFSMILLMIDAVITKR